jgi:glycosyltransferase involved in cell wall biosynthesis
LKISLLVFDLSTNCLGRAYLIGKVLERRYQVEIVGPAFSGEIWQPQLDDFKYKKVAGVNYPFFLSSVKDMLKKIDGDVIYSFKLRPTSYGISLLKNISGQRLPIILDIDDWEVGGRICGNPLSLLYHSITDILDPNDLPYIVLTEFLANLVDERTVASRFLQKKFGGVYVPHGVDVNTYNPSKFEREQLRAKWGLTDQKVLSFIGTPRPHKGLDDLIRALNLLNDSKIRLMMTGDEKDPYVQHLLSLGKDKIIFLGFQPRSAEPILLNIADIVVLPQRTSFAAMGQVPAKIFTAMAMAKPIIATSVSDIPEILSGCGWVVEPRNSEQIAKAIRHVLNNPEEATKIGWKARQKCINHYSYDTLEKDLHTIFKKYE